MASWLRINRALFAGRAAWHERRARHRGVAAAQGHRRAWQGSEGAPPRLLHVSWGRIGDAVLSTGILKHFRALFPGVEIVHLGRPETRAIVAPHVDRFESLDTGKAGASRASLVQRLDDGPWRWILGDLHLPYGGFAELAPLLARLQAERTIVSDGYSRDPGLLPGGRIALPKHFERIAVRDPRPSRQRPLATRHVSLDARHYLSAFLQRLSPAVSPPTDLRPEIHAPPPGSTLSDVLEAVVLQPFSNNRKKDPDPALWDAVCAAFPTLRFIAIGTNRDALAQLTAPNVDNRGGATTLEEAMELIRDCRAFLGPDSGMTHIASAMGRPTVCVSQSANLGYFFPYPAELQRGPQWTVDDPESRACSGCFMTCEHEPIWRTAQRGARCLRAIRPEPVIAALSAAVSAKSVVAATTAKSLSV